MLIGCPAHLATEFTKRPQDCLVLDLLFAYQGLDHYRCVKHRLLAIRLKNAFEVLEGRCTAKQIAEQVQRFIDAPLRIPITRIIVATG